MRSIRNYHEKSYYLSFNASTLALNPVSHRKSHRAQCPLWEKGTYQTLPPNALVLQISFIKGEPQYFLRPVLSTGNISKVVDHFPPDLLDAIRTKHPWIDDWAIDPAKTKKPNNYLPTEIAPQCNDKAFRVRKNKLKTVCTSFGVTGIPLDAFAMDMAKLNYDPLKWEKRFGLAPSKYREFVSHTPQQETVITWFGSDGLGAGQKIEFAPTRYLETESGLEKVSGTLGLAGSENFRYLVRAEYRIIHHSDGSPDEYIGVEFTILDSPTRIKK